MDITSHPDSAKSVFEQDIVDSILQPDTTESVYHQDIIDSTSRANLTKSVFPQDAMDSTSQPVTVAAVLRHGRTRMVKKLSPALSGAVSFTTVSHRRRST